MGAIIMKMPETQEIQNTLNTRLSYLMDEASNINERYKNRLLTFGTHELLIEQNKARQDEIRRTLSLIVSVRHN